MKMPDSELRVSPSTASARARTAARGARRGSVARAAMGARAPARADVGADVIVARDATVASVAIVAEERRACARGKGTRV